MCGGVILLWLLGTLVEYKLTPSSSLISCIYNIIPQNNNILFKKNFFFKIVKGWQSSCSQKIEFAPAQMTFHTCLLVGVEGSADLTDEKDKV